MLSQQFFILGNMPGSIPYIKAVFIFDTICYYNSSYNVLEICTSHNTSFLKSQLLSSHFRMNSIDICLTDKLDTLINLKHCHRQKYRGRQLY